MFLSNNRDARFFTFYCISGIILKIKHFTMDIKVTLIEIFYYFKD